MRWLALLLLLAGPFQAQAAPEPIAREYKLQLASEDFAQDPAKNLRRLAADLKAGLAQQGVALSGEFSKKKRRELVFFDTPGTCALRRAGWILRQREAKSGKPELTLKWRGEAGQARQPTADAAGIEFKIEEDVSPPAHVGLSYSWSRKGTRPLPDVAAVAAAFPALSGLEQVRTEPVQIVAGLRIEERNYELLQLKFAGQAYPLEARVWRTQGERLLALELSFRFAETPAGRSEAMRIFGLLQGQGGVMAAQSKTERVYRAAAGFCRP